jgi:hypothetical protein
MRIYSRATGDLTFEDLFFHMREEAGSDVASYPEIFDCRAATINLSASHIRMLAEHRKAIAASQPPAPVAFVGSKDVFLGMIRMFGTLTGDLRPISIFSTVLEAESWLDSLEGISPIAA